MRNSTYWTMIATLSAFGAFGPPLQALLHAQEGLQPSASCRIDRNSLRPGTTEIISRNQFSFLCTKSTAFPEPLFLHSSLTILRKCDDTGFPGAATGVFRTADFTISVERLQDICSLSPVDKGKRPTLVSDNGDVFTVEVFHQGPGGTLAGSLGFRSTVRYKLTVSRDLYIDMLTEAAEALKRAGDRLAPCAEKALQEAQGSASFPSGLIVDARCKMTSPDPDHNIQPPTDSAETQ